MSRLSFGIVLLLASQVVAQTTIHVPADAQTIQIAIQQAQPFDTIIVAPGTYSEAISFMGKAIAVQSENPNDPATVAATIIDAGGLGSVVTFSGSEGNLHTALDGFTITGGIMGIEGNHTLAAIRNCHVHDNSSWGIREILGEITNCMVSDNESGGLSGCGGTISFCTIDNNNGFGMSGCDGTITDCQITNTLKISNQQNSTGSGLKNCDGSVVRCLISNCARHGLENCFANIRQSVISGNSIDGLFDCDGTLIENSIIAGNKKDGFENCSLAVLHCNVIDNSAFGFRNHPGSIMHTIIWNNMAGPLSTSTTPILSGTVNPFFVQPGQRDNITGLWIDGDLHLTPDSPYIDAGDPFYGDNPSDPTEDLDGNPRVAGERVDIGAYEFQGPCEGADFDEDGTPDICDSDIDDDGITNTLDACDFTPLGVSVDTNGRPHADLNLDCLVNLADFAVFQLSFR